MQPLRHPGRRRCDMGPQATEDVSQSGAPTNLSLALKVEFVGIDSKTMGLSKQVVGSMLTKFPET